MVICLGRPSPAVSSGLPAAHRFRCGRCGSHLAAYLALLRLGVAVPPLLPATRWALTPPFHPYPPCGGRSVFCGPTVALRRPGVTWQPTRWSSDFPRCRPGGGTATIAPCPTVAGQGEKYSARGAQGHGRKRGIGWGPSRGRGRPTSGPGRRPPRPPSLVTGMRSAPGAYPQPWSPARPAEAPRRSASDGPAASPGRAESAR